MSLQNDSFQIKAQNKIPENGKGFVNNVDISFDLLDKGTGEVASMKNSFMPGWRTATLHVIDKLNKRVFLISEPYWPNEDGRITEMTKRRLYDIYAEYRSI